MCNVLMSNRRIAARNPLEIKGILTIADNVHFQEEIIINNISLDGIQIVFADNDLLYEYLKYTESEEPHLLVKFAFEQYQFELACTINWLKIHDIGEKSFYVLSGLRYGAACFTSIKNNLINMLVEMNMSKMYLGTYEKREETLIG